MALSLAARLRNDTDACDDPKATLSTGTCPCHDCFHTVGGGSGMLRNRIGVVLEELEGHRRRARHVKCAVQPGRGFTQATLLAGQLVVDASRRRRHSWVMGDSEDPEDILFQSEITVTTRGGGYSRWPAIHACVECTSPTHSAHYVFPLTGPQAVAIAVDRSHTNALYGMGAANWQWNRTLAGVHALLNVLTQEDYVYVVFFAGDLLPFAGGFVPASRENLVAIGAFLRNVSTDGDGRTDFLAVIRHLDRVLAQTNSPQPTRLLACRRLVFILSDGRLARAGDSAAVVQVASRWATAAAPPTHVFTFGLSRAPDERLLRQLACAVHGVFFFVGEEVFRIGDLLFAAMATLIPNPEVGDWNEALWPPQPVATRYVGVDGVLRRAACAATRWAGDIAVVCAYFPGATLPVTENCPPREVLENFSESYWAHVRRGFQGAPCHCVQTADCDGFAAAPAGTAAAPASSAFRATPLLLAALCAARRAD